jgi:hypothetical protein
MRRVVPAWAFFILLGLFVALVVPLGEGFDEPWHLGYVQYIAQTGRLLPGPQIHLSSELDQFLVRHPIGWRLRDIFPSLHSHDEYWQQPRDERLRIDEDVRQMRFGGLYQEGSSRFSTQYESHQPPLYYALAAPLFLLSSALLPLPDVFLLVRIGSMLLASTVVPLSYLLAKRISGSLPVATSVALLVSMFPGLYPDIVRVSNDALAVPLAAVVFLLLAQFLESRSDRHALLLGLALLAGLSTKAFFIPVLFAVIISFLWLKEIRSAAIVFVTSGAGWIWYARNFWITGSLTGLPETVQASTTVTSSVSSIGLIGWLDVFRLAAVSHVWMGNWSLLQYRGWIYQTVLYMFGVGVAGFILHTVKSEKAVNRVMVFIYLSFAASLIYYATQVFQKTGIPVIQGWYLSPLVPLEAFAFVTGIRFLLSARGMTFAVAFAALCFLAMSVYGNVFIAAPYYTGMISHASSGHLRAYHPLWTDIPVICERLTRLHPWIPDAIPLSLASGVLLLGLALIYFQIKDRSWLEKSSS